MKRINNNDRAASGVSSAGAASGAGAASSGVSSVLTHGQAKKWRACTIRALRLYFASIDIKLHSWFKNSATKLYKNLTGMAVTRLNSITDKMLDDFIILLRSNVWDTLYKMDPYNMIIFNLNRITNDDVYQSMTNDFIFRLPSSNITNITRPADLYKLFPREYLQMLRDNQIDMDMVNEIEIIYRYLKRPISTMHAGLLYYIFKDKIWPILAQQHPFLSLTKNFVPDSYKFKAPAKGSLCDTHIKYLKKFYRLFDIRKDAKKEVDTHGALVWIYLRAKYPSMLALPNLSWS